MKTEATNTQLLEALKYVLPLLEDCKKTFGDDYAVKAYNAAQEAIKNAPIVEALNAETFVKTAEFGCNTGGHIYNDILTLKNGYIIRIAEDGIGIYANEEDDQTGETAGFANFPETN